MSPTENLTKAEEALRIARDVDGYLEENRGRAGDVISSLALAVKILASAVVELECRSP